jgi:hypothetical protein
MEDRREGETTLYWMGYGEKIYDGWDMEERREGETKLYWIGYGEKIYNG